jgi:TetR/AcrR family transcriptional repressor of multidrug resistance operon
MDKSTQILNAAEAILAQHGFYAFSMHHLAETAGVAAGTIYRYFENKEALMDALQEFIRKEAANDVFTGWQDTFTTKQKYDLMWNNVFNAVIANPKRLIVIEMLHCIPNINQTKIALLDDVYFKRLMTFYQEGIETKQFLDWQIFALIAVSFDTSINLAKKIIRNELQLNQAQLDQVREASWTIIQNPHFNQQD